MTETIQRAARIQAFLKDDVIREAIERCERTFIEEMIAGDTAEKRAAAQGKVRALRALVQELTVMLDAGEREVLELAKVAAAEARAPKR